MLDRSKSTIIVRFECVPNTYTCHERHIHGRIYGQIRDPLRRKEIASHEPRITQIKSLKAKPFNPHSTKRDYHPSHSQAKRIRSNQERCDLFEKVREIQSKNIQEHLADSNVSMMRKGNIHELQSTATYFTVSLWSKETITLYTNLAKFDDPGIFIDSTELLVAPIDGRKLEIQLHTKHEFQVPQLKASSLCGNVILIAKTNRYSMDLSLHLMNMSKNIIMETLFHQDVLHLMIGHRFVRHCV